MNERIKELAEQASHQSPDGYPVTIPYSKVFAKKFAELIVKECVQTLIDNTPERYTNESAEEDWDKGYDRAMRDCVYHIQEHFEVEL